jgi:pimeloyl-ACP methyl ester carboxylesterase
VPEFVGYDEFAYFQENAEEYGLPYEVAPAVRREFVDLGDGRRLSALVWSVGDPQLVFLHGGAQNAHTWDTVAMALGRPLVCVDLPGHGHSDGYRGGPTDLRANADDVAVAISALAPRAGGVIGMSLGGMTALALAAGHPELVRALVLVDVTPGANAGKAGSILAFVNGPESFDDFDGLLERTVQFNPTRTVSSLRRGILHNAVQREDGSWVWRHARHRTAAAFTKIDDQFGGLWEAISNLEAPLMLARGMRAQSVVDDADEAELLRRCPGARVEHVTEAGHSLQGDTPLELAALIDDFVPPL